MKNLLKEFETFAIHGNAVDLAVGVVLGAAFSAITNSFTTNVITPIISIFIGKIRFEDLVFHLPNGSQIAYGIFIQVVINFFLVAVILFLMVKLFNSLSKKRRKEEQKPSENPELKVLMEIRDALTGRKRK